MIYFLAALLTAFTVTLFIIPKCMTFLKNTGITGIDIQKKEQPVLPEMGGLPVLIGFLAGTLLYVAFITFLTTSGKVYTINIIGAILTIMIITMIGMIDDLSTLIKSDIKDKDKSFKRTGIKQKHKFLMPIAAAVPLIVLNSGISSITIPFMGVVDVGLLYPLFLIPIGIIGASNATNMLAGLNGLETGLGIVLLSFIGIFAYINGAYSASIIALIFVASLVAFLIYNKYPAKIMPGDSLTYTIGAVAAVAAIIGNIEKFAVIMFIPWFIELILKARSRFKAENFGALQKDGTLKCKSRKNYSLIHVVMHCGRFTEKQIVMIIIAFEILLGLVAMLLLL